MSQVAARHGLSNHFQMEGPPISLNYLTRDTTGQVSLPMRTLLAQELLRRGVMMPWVAVSQSHGSTELQLTLEALDDALEVYAQALDGGVERFLQGPPIRPVFRSHN
jgi:glutamate-1-semialdehyde 2,1-aminomutase